MPSKMEGSASYNRETGVLKVRRVLRRGRRKTEVVERYAVQHLSPDPSVGAPAVRLIKPDGESYDLIRRSFGWTCECRDFTTRRANSREPCKHITAVTKAGVLDITWNVDPPGDAWEGPTDAG